MGSPIFAKSAICNDDSSAYPVIFRRQYGYCILQTIVVNPYFKRLSSEILPAMWSVPFYETKFKEKNAVCWDRLKCRLRFNISIYALLLQSVLLLQIISLENEEVLITIFYNL